MTPFENRRDAGRKLAAELTGHGPASLVPELSPGGVPDERSVG